FRLLLYLISINLIIVEPQGAVGDERIESAKCTVGQLVDTSVLQLIDLVFLLLVSFEHDGIFIINGSFVLDIAPLSQGADFLSFYMDFQYGSAFFTNTYCYYL